MELITDRLILREFNEIDWRGVLDYQVNPMYLRYYAWTERTPEDVQEFVQAFIETQKEHPRTKYQLAITLKSTRRLIGNCGIRMDAPDAVQAEIGYELSPVHWGQGYATEAMETVVEFGFKQLKVHRIWAWCNAENLGSVRVLEKLGMRLEGRLRENEYFKGRWWDTLLFGMLEGEWR